MTSSILPDRRDTACPLSLKERTPPSRSLTHLLSATIRSSKDIASTPSSTTLPGIGIATAKCSRDLTNFAQDGHEFGLRSSAHSSHTTWPQGIRRYVPIWSMHLPQGVCILAPAAESRAAIDWTFVRGFDDSALFAVGRCSSKSVYHGKPSSRYVCVSIGDGV